MIVAEREGMEDSMGVRLFVTIPLICGLVCVACASMTPDQKTRNDLYWDAAKEYEGRFRTLHLDRIDSEGNVSLHVDAESRQELPAFNACYRAAVKKQMERRKQAGLAIPDGLNEEPTADLD
jgi:hypothetical protein